MDRARVARAARDDARKKRNRRRATPFRERMPPLRVVPGALARAGLRGVRRALPALILASIAAGVGGAGYAGYRFLTTSPRFAIETIEVHGAVTLGEDGIRARIPVTTGDNIFVADMGDVEAALEREPWIADATVRRRLPRTVEIEVRERRAAAVVALDGMYLADEDGRVFKRARVDLGETYRLPVITGLERADLATDPDGAADEIRLALAALARWSDPGRPAIGEVRVDGQRHVTLYTFDDAVAIRLGDAEGDELSARLTRFDAAWAALTPDERAAASAIHLDHDTRPDHVTVAFAR